ncbi:hypothetical protein Acr_17g0006780 [Actinidia rufa]|uniref:Uncharacterized protein n=1 Tax=Actinidia rufa TaxID=165716 RepID=A0A7J0G2U1_9ERIC|nr:hypothetical protein Acr_17g0006780 [Actinidia rufa]
MVRMARSINLLWYKCCARKWWIIGGKVLHQKGVVFVHNPNLLGDAMHFTVETLKVWSLVMACHQLSSIIQRPGSVWSSSVLNISTDLGDLCKGTNVIGRGEAAQTPSGVEIKPRRKLG